jgi:putative nucleotidyltransferase with HDIG domain
LVGGSLRDLLLGRTPADWDLATSARPDEVRSLFAAVVPTGERHGTMTVLTSDRAYEVTTLREDGVYSDMRHPDQVEFTRDVKRDLERRDFTINAMAFDLGTRELIDPAGGQADLARRLLRAVGDPDIRFAEDALRILRAARFAAQLEFRIDEPTRAAMARGAGHVPRIAAERIQKELLLLLDAGRPSRGLSLLHAIGVLRAILPELVEGVGVTQNRHHRYDVFTHALFACDEVESGGRRVRLAALLHDVGKPRVRQLVAGEGTFYGHDKLGAELADAMLRRLRFANDDREAVVRLVRHHLFEYREEWSDAAVRRFIRRVGEDLIPDLFALRLADARAAGFTPTAPASLARLRARIEAAVRDRERGMPLDLAVDGRDVMAALGLAPGPEVGRWLARLWEAVLEDPGLNTRERLLAFVQTQAARGDPSPPFHPESESGAF